jgi:hypothetical protein
MNRSILKWIITKNKIKGCSRYTLPELQRVVDTLYAVKKIQRWFRKKLYLDAIDPITLESIQHPCFIFCTSFGKLHFYDIRALVEYIITSGKTIDPMTREQYSDKQLQRLDQLAKEYLPIRYRSTLKIKKDPRYYRRIQLESNEITVFQMRYSELRSLLLSAFEVYMEVDFPFVVEGFEYSSFREYTRLLIMELQAVIRRLNRLGLNATELVENIRDDLRRNNQTITFDIL